MSFLPGVVLALIAIYPGQIISLELASILLIFPGMTWKMNFSFYQYLFSIPQELIEASRIDRLNNWRRFWTLELPSGVISLVWNSVMSVTGRWFFLIAIESFTLGNKNLHLPGLGSYLATAANKGDYRAIAWGLLVLIGVIVLIDFFIWRPLIAWAEKFKFETVEAQNMPQSVVLNASIVSEYIQFQGKVVTKPGLGATISQATASGNFSLLLGATAVMSLVVVLTNRLVWRPLYRWAQQKYQLLV